jgi:hypothetical protein
MPLLVVKPYRATDPHATVLVQEREQCLPPAIRTARILSGAGTPRQPLLVTSLLRRSPGTALAALRANDVSQAGLDGHGQARLLGSCGCGRARERPSRYRLGRRPRVSRLRDDATASPGGSEREESLGQHARKSSAAGVSSASVRGRPQTEAIVQPASPACPRARLVARATLSQPAA